MEEPIEERYMDVLQNIEFGIVQVDNSEDDLTDWEVGDALDALIQTYYAEANGRTPPALRLTPLKRKVYESVKTMCEWRLGRIPLTTEAGDAAPQEAHLTPITPQEIVACLKRVRLSVKRWHGSNGRRGYLEFIANFVR